MTGISRRTARQIKRVLTEARPNPGGTFPIDVRFDAGKVRIACRAGITSRRFANELRAMLRDLWKQPVHRHLVLDIASDRRGIFEVLRDYLTGQLANAGPTRHEDRAIDLDGWLAGLQASDAHKRRLRQAFAMLLKGTRTQHLSDLPPLLEAYRTRCVAAHTPRSFNMAKSAAQALLRDTVGRRHSLYLSVADVRSMTEAKRGVAGLSIEEARTVRSRLAALPGTYLATEAAAAWWALVTTGMNPKEYFQDGFDVLPDRIAIHGQKRGGRERVVPRVTFVAAPAISQAQFAKLLRKVGTVPYAGRKTFARLMEDARIPRARREIYRGHAKRDIGDVYERYEVDAFLVEDAAALKKVIGPEGLALVNTIGIVAIDQWQPAVAAGASKAAS